MKVVLNLWDGVRYDAIFKVNEWMGLPNFFRLVKNGVLFTNLYTHEPVLTPDCVGRIMHNAKGKPLSQSLWEKMKIKSCYVGYPEDQNNPEPIRIPHCDLVDCLYERQAEQDALKRHGTLNRHRITKPDQVRLDIACKKIQEYDFTFVYFSDTDAAAHICRDRNQHVYHYGSPYVHCIKQCDRLLGHLLNTLDWCAKDDYVIIVVADHGMTDEGRHSVANWTMSEVMHVPLAIMGKGIRHNWMENARYFTHDITSGVVGLFKGDAEKTMFKWALDKWEKKS